MTQVMKTMDSDHARHVRYFVVMTLFCPLGNLIVLVLAFYVTGDFLIRNRLPLLIPAMFLLIPVCGYLVAKKGRLFEKTCSLRGPALINDGDLYMVFRSGRVCHA